MEKLDIFKQMLIVGIGGFVGGALRAAFGLVSTSVWLTFGINVVGAFLLAVLGAFLARRLAEPATWQNFLGTGILGGFTTFSTFMLQLHQLPLGGAVLYGAATLGFGWLAIELAKGWVATWAS
ncbi:MAG TPA: CrcB family protein [Lactobacillaceae bacterium]|jgi:CrcB protein